MNTLFPVEPAGPEGFSYAPDFLTETEENRLYAEISGIPLSPLVFQGFAAKRLVKSFGYHYHFDSRRVTPGEPIPKPFHFLIEKVADHLAMHPEAFAELLVTEYPPGSVINWHRDGPPFKLIAGVSLLSDCTMRFRPYGETKRTRSSVITYPVHRRSLYAIQGVAREEWEHSIAPVAERRYSITLRTLR